MAPQNATFEREKRYVGDKVTVTLEAIGDDKIRATSLSWDGERVARSGKIFEVAAFGKRLVLFEAPRPAEYIDMEESDPTGLKAAGYGPLTK